MFAAGDPKLETVPEDRELDPDLVLWATTSAQKVNKTTIFRLYVGQDATFEERPSFKLNVHDFPDPTVRPPSHPTSQSALNVSWKKFATSHEASPAGE